MKEKDVILGSTAYLTHDEHQTRWFIYSRTENVEGDISFNLVAGPQAFNAVAREMTYERNEAIMPNREEWKT